MALRRLTALTLFISVAIAGVSCKAAAHCDGGLCSLRAPSPQPNPVNFTLYLESRCGDCQAFIGSQLRLAYEQVLDIMNASLVPYGNAEETFNNKTNLWEFHCQHGVEECQFNIVETCAVHYYNFSTIFPVILCLEIPSGSPTEETKKCFSKHQLDYKDVLACYNGKLGNSLEHQMALKTDALKPPHQYVPWVTVNGVHTDAIQQAAQTSLVQLICDTYKGPGMKPPACNKKS